MEKSCIVHYDGFESYSDIKAISDINKMRITEATFLREKAKGYNEHKKQCDMLPDILISEQRGIPLELCYKKFTYIISKSKSTKEAKRSSSRLSSLSSTSSGNNFLYPKECNICKKYYIKVKVKKLVPRTITTKEACETIKSSA